MAISIINIVTLSALSLTLPLNTHSFITEHWWATTTFDVEQLKYTWIINNFDSLRLAENNGLSSPDFWADDDDSHKWHLSLEEIADSNVHGVYLNPNFNDPLTVQFSISINDAEDSAIHNFINGEHSGFEVSIGTGFDLINKNSNAITIECNIKKIDKVKNNTRRCQAPKEDNSPSKDIFNDYELLFENGSFSDVTFYINSKTLRAHKAILGARSSVFLEQLRRDPTAYNRFNRDIVIEIRDMEFPVFKELLRYIYIGQVQNLDDIADKLLIAAQQYNVQGLIKLCEQQLCKNLNIHNAFALLSFAYDQNLHELRSVVAKFIAGHGSSIVRTGEFKDIEKKLNNSLLDVFHAHYDN
ncbi:speckle-type POZ protein B-like [Phymastichus coffea]|uniref:speckle-type POZ protein B-like n=1 Tax=Phymastichus coffea TaxID=108790 RepID=UPI00273C7674|nr:speckle-type POZ protein B-like [Phymastichus coffea]